MTDTDLQYVSGQDGTIQAVLVPYESWKRLASTIETFHLSSSTEMRRRILEAAARGSGISFDESLRQIEYDSAGFEDLAWWNKHRHETAVRIVQLIKEVQKEPFTGKGHPVKLRDEFEGCWSRRIEGDHRLIYQVLDDKIRILACRYHLDPV